MSELEKNRLSEAEELVSELESIDGIKEALVDDYKNNLNRVSFFATPKDNANLRSVSQIVRNRVEENDTFNIIYFNTPSETRRDWYDFDMEPF